MVDTSDPTPAGNATVGVREFRENISRYLQQARDGATLTIVSRGQPIAEVRAPAMPSPPLEPRKPGFLKGKIKYLADDWDADLPEDVIDAIENK